MNDQKRLWWFEFLKKVKIISSLLLLDAEPPKCAGTSGKKLKNLFYLKNKFLLFNENIWRFLVTRVLKLLVVKTSSLVSWLSHLKVGWVHTRPWPLLSPLGNVTNWQFIVNNHQARFFPQIHPPTCTITYSLCSCQAWFFFWSKCLMV